MFLLTFYAIAFKITYVKGRKNMAFDGIVLNAVAEELRENIIRWKS